MRKLLGGGYLRRQNGSIGIYHILRRWLCTELSYWIQCTLLTHSRQHLVKRQPIIMQSVGLEPDTHSILASTHNIDLAHTIYLRQTILQVYQCVVGQKLVIVSSITRQGIDHQKARIALACHHTLLNDRLRQLRGDRSHIILREDSIHIGRGANIKCHLHIHRAITRAGGLHIEHIAHAHHTLRQRGSNGVIHRHSISSHIVCRHLHHRRCNLRILLNRKVKECHHTQQSHRHSHRNGKHRASNKKLSHSYSVLTGTTFTPLRSF